MNLKIWERGGDGIFSMSSGRIVLCCEDSVKMRSEVRGFR